MEETAEGVVLNNNITLLGLTKRFLTSAAIIPVGVGGAIISVQILLVIS